jgi:Na+/H+ antiporter NhaC
MKKSLAALLLLVLITVLGFAVTGTNTVPASHAGIQLRRPVPTT